MDWIKRMTNALDYVEKNLTEPLDPQNISQQANTSSFHFQRMFSMLCDVTLAEYIRRRRLTLAAKEIQQGKGILETAVKYCYESQASFTRAFSRMHGFSPGVTREPGMKIKAYPPMSFQITIKGEQSMDYEIRELGKFTIAGEKRHFTSKEGENFVKIPQFWQEMNDQKIGNILSCADPKGILKGSLLGVCMNFSQDTEEFDYMIGMEPKEDADISSFYSQVVPSLTWAIFKGSGPMPEAIQKVWKRIYGEWFSATE
jgi:AraC family transcriptional regulator